MNQLEAAMKFANVVMRRRYGMYAAFYDGDDAPFMEGIGYTEEYAIHDLYQYWKRFHYPEVV